jgi:hypothetical protein
MIGYKSYTAHLDRLITDSAWGRKKSAPSQFTADLNGGAAKALRRLVGEDQIKECGAYFTGELLGRNALKSAAQDCGLSPVFDPACGAGDLLLRWAEFLPVYASLERTISHWETLLFGCDLHQEFVDATKRRLILSAISRGAKLEGAILQIHNRFPGIVQGDFLKCTQFPTKATVVLNPPFNQASQSDFFHWATGKMSQAAVFIAKCIQLGMEGQRIVAILPDVLRSGTRYAKWRSWIEQRLCKVSITTEGRFDNFADVDVFVLDGVIRKTEVGENIEWTRDFKRSKNLLETICNVRVGTVVPHRDPKRGPWVTYFAVPDLPAWQHVCKGRKRRVSSTTLTAPFVVVRRTSSPSDKQRPVASIVNTEGVVAIENHLIALIPRDGKLQTCERIMEILKAPSTREFLDRNIRCRHLTVQALKKIQIDP